MQFLWGPISFIVAAFITIEHPLRHPLQGLVCIGQMYGLILYYATSMFELYFRGVAYSRPEAYYFWIYYFAVNFIWMIVPGSEHERLSDLSYTEYKLTKTKQSFCMTVLVLPREHSRLCKGSRLLLSQTARLKRRNKML